MIASSIHVFSTLPPFDWRLIEKPSPVAGIQSAKEFTINCLSRLMETERWRTRTWEADYGDSQHSPQADSGGSILPRC